MKKKPRRQRIPKMRTRKSVKKSAWDIFSIFIRTRDCLRTTGTLTRGRCITCGKFFSFERLQAGHFIQGRGGAVLFDEIGVNAQCYICNIERQGESLIYRRKLVELHGEDFVRLLENKRWIQKKHKTFELDCLRLYYHKETEKLRKKFYEHTS